MQRLQPSSFAGALVSDAPSVELGEHAKDFDWVIGGWSATVRDYDDDCSVSETSGEWWFSWVLEGRAIQDVWIVPPRVDRTKTPSDNNRYGMTIRFFDLVDQIWRIVWVNPVTCVKNELSGRRQGDRIVLEGMAGSERIRWSFNEICDHSFVWLGEHQGADKRWVTGAEFILKRKAINRP